MMRQQVLCVCARACVCARIRACMYPDSAIQATTGRAEERRQLDAHMQRTPLTRMQHHHERH
jgi:hypothetical protein